MSEGTKARPDEITTFGREVQEQSQNLMDGYGDTMTGAMAANVGACGFPEAALMRSRYASMAQAAVAFTQESFTGLMALSYASMTVAQNYREGDSDQQVLMTGVDAAFTPKPGQDSLSGQQQAAKAAAARQQATEDRQRRQMGEDPSRDWDAGYHPTSTPTSSTNATQCVVTPSQQVGAHDDRAEDDGYDSQEHGFDPKAEAEAAAAPTPSPTSQPTPTPSGVTPTPTATPGAAPTPSATPTPSN